MALGDLGHGIAEVGKAGDQCETVEREAGVALHEHFAHKAAEGLVEALGIRRLRMV